MTDITDTRSLERLEDFKDSIDRSQREFIDGLGRIEYPKPLEEETDDYEFNDEEDEPNTD